MTFISLILMFIGKKIKLSDRIIIKESLNQESFSGMVDLIKRIFKYTFIFEDFLLWHQDRSQIPFSLPLRSGKVWES